ncbi:uncharacterized protein BX663DRAFT_504603 [Cokeromyces recurvatus]|uniref:uncharacterized protein n=1 Tax=Cokeromyces recurvatus TaxID=90255 RepID=UPI00221FA5C6|nr:uncharacterized protein BX663DRAFT_504603 [Cokeromyces recurvatus]KAI7904294.1 hypothetical protein BX663DRAFT_504603 [Cokeromyces recurvatus]
MLNFTCFFFFFIVVVVVVEAVGDSFVPVVIVFGIVPLTICLRIFNLTSLASLSSLTFHCFI